MGLPANEIEKAWIDDKDTAGILRMQYYIYFFYFNKVRMQEHILLNLLTQTPADKAGD